jgi:16S rRNA (adenine1518-N6/adenine1519-N6)-dimethyltransferase
VQPLSEIKSLLASRGLAPRKSLGQNFLIDHNLIRKLADAAALQPGDTVLEVGPGTGALTEELLARACRVVAVELDKGLAALLRERFAAFLSDPATERRSHAAPEGGGAGGSLALIEGDALDGPRGLNAAAAEILSPTTFPPSSLRRSVAPSPPRPFTLVANLPYAAGTPLMLALLTHFPHCRGQYVTIQREVADRLLAKPGTKDYGTLSIVAQAMAQIERIATLPPECFWPRPEVTSAMVAITPLAQPLTNNPEALTRFAQELFSKRRKQLGSTLKSLAPPPTQDTGQRTQNPPPSTQHSALSTSPTSTQHSALSTSPPAPFLWPPGIRPEMRAEELSVPDFIALAHASGRL